MKTKLFLFIFFIISLFLIQACAREVPNETNSVVKQKIKAKLIEFNDKISNTKFAESDDDNYSFWYRRAYNMRYDDKVINDDRYQKTYAHGLAIEDNNFYPDRYILKHKPNTLTIAGVTFKASDELRKIPDLVLCDTIDYETFEIE